MPSDSQFDSHNDPTRSDRAKSGSASKRSGGSKAKSKPSNNGEKADVAKNDQIQGRQAKTPSANSSRPKPPRPKPPKPPAKPGARRSRVKLPDIDSAESESPPLTRMQWLLSLLPTRRVGAGFVVSTLTHIVLFVVLALIAIAPRGDDGVLAIDSGVNPNSRLSTQLRTEQRVQEQSLESEATFQVAPKVELPLPKADTVGVQSQRPASSASRLSTAADLEALSNLPTGGGLEGRSEERRRELVVSEGGTEGSEKAVDLGLAWLAAHQRENGAWWFNFHDSECRGRCRHPGSVGTSTASTGLALLCFLGRGETPSQGKYQEEVQRGLYYLQNRMVFTKYGGDLQEGSMYGHAIATLALCEAYGMTQDQSLKPIAQKAIDFIVHAQHDKGGWRYTPGQPGDATVTGWQIMALRSAHLAGLEVPSPTLEMSKMFFDSIQTHAGARYKYLPEEEEETPVPTSVGLLCRMYLGWTRNMTPIREGVKYLVELGPSTSDLYFDYYATQVLHHYGDPYWDGWNRTMRDYLINSQAKAGHELGSWHFKDEHGDQAGRLYSTAMAIMILEVYYRYLPLYESRAVEFPL